MATTSEIKSNKIILKAIHTSLSRIKEKKKGQKKRKRKNTSCMSVLFLIVKEYFRVQRDLFNSL